LVNCLLAKEETKDHGAFLQVDVSEGKREELFGPSVLCYMEGCGEHEEKSDSSWEEKSKDRRKEARFK
jgi:hypothetical protein